ncbi:MAG: hypothetical protein H7839_10220, partial [Magnetococcus sp. YQC-5]
APATESMDLVMSCNVKPCSSMALSVQGFELGPEPFDVKEIKLGHMQWLDEMEKWLRDQALGQEPGEMVMVSPGLSHCLELCVDRHSDHPFFIQLRKHHETIGALAAQMRTLAQNNDLEAAFQTMVHLKGASQKSFDTLDALYLGRPAE